MHTLTATYPLTPSTQSPHIHADATVNYARVCADVFKRVLGCDCVWMRVCFLLAFFSLLQINTVRES